MSTDNAEMTTTETAQPKKTRAPRRARGSKRTDPHRPGAIIPAHYQDRVYYALPTTQGGMPVPGWNLEAMRNYTAANPMFVREGGYGGAGECGICGSHFITGAIFLHDLTGQSLHVGHDCADKYDMMANWSEAMLEAKRRKDATAKAIATAQNREKRNAFCQAHPGLREALDFAEAIYEKHKENNFLEPLPFGIGIILDMERKLIRFRSLSEKQVALALKLANAIQNPPPPKPEEVKVPAPEGRQTFRGIVVGLRTQEGDWGDTTKITIKVETEAGIWLAWGTLPDGIDIPEGYSMGEAGVRGQTIELTGTLTRGKDPHFAFYKRPTKAKIIPTTKGE